MSRCTSRKMYSLRLLAGVLLTLSAGFLISTPAASRAGEAASPEGPALYAEHCAGCHGPLGRTLLTGRSASRIRSAIRHFAVMSGLDRLDDGELGAIAAALAVPDAPSPEKASSGLH